MFLINLIGIFVFLPYLDAQVQPESGTFIHKYIKHLNRTFFISRRDACYEPKIDISSHPKETTFCENTYLRTETELRGLSCNIIPPNYNPHRPPGPFVVQSVAGEYSQFIRSFSNKCVTEYPYPYPDLLPVAVSLTMEILTIRRPRYSDNPSAVRILDMFEFDVLVRHFWFDQRICVRKGYADSRTEYNEDVEKVLKYMFWIPEVRFYGAKKSVRSHVMHRASAFFGKTHREQFNNINPLPVLFSLTSRFQVEMHCNEALNDTEKLETMSYFPFERIRCKLELYLDEPSREVCLRWGENPRINFDPTINKDRFLAGIFTKITGIESMKACKYSWLDEMENETVPCLRVEISMFRNPKSVAYRVLFLTIIPTASAVFSVTLHIKMVFARILLILSSCFCLYCVYSSFKVVTEREDGTTETQQNYFIYYIILNGVIITMSSLEYALNSLAYRMNINAMKAFEDKINNIKNKNKKFEVKPITKKILFIWYYILKPILNTLTRVLVKCYSILRLLTVLSYIIMVVSVIIYYQVKYNEYMKIVEGKSELSKTYILPKNNTEIMEKQLKFINSGDSPESCSIEDFFEMDDNIADDAGTDQSDNEIKDDQISRFNVEEIRNPYCLSEYEAIKFAMKNKQEMNEKIKVI